MACDFSSIGASVNSFGCFILGAVLFSIFSNVSTKSSAPIFDNLSHNSPDVSSLSIGVFVCKIISPESIPSSKYIVVTPVSLSPFKIAHCIGAEPLYCGSNDG